MRELPISNVWMEKLLRLSMSLKYNPKFTNKEEILALYDRLNEEQKASIEGQEIRVNLFSSKTVKEGDDMADADLFDLDGKVHHLADFKGKTICYLIFEQRLWSLHHGFTRNERDSGAI